MEMALPVVGIVVLVVLFAAVINRYRRCPSDKILVIYGGSGSKKSAKCVHGGGAFVWPIIEDYAYLSLTPISIDANLTNALSRQNIRVDVPCRFTVGISTDEECMTAAAERLLGLSAQQIQELARDILFGQLRLVIATMSIEELNSDRDKFLEAISSNVEVELKKIGLRLINVNVTDINDESGYIEALGQEAAAKAMSRRRLVRLVRLMQIEKPVFVLPRLMLRLLRVRMRQRLRLPILMQSVVSVRQRLSVRLLLPRRWHRLRHSRKHTQQSRKPRRLVLKESVLHSRLTYLSLRRLRSSVRLSRQRQRLRRFV